MRVWVNIHLYQQRSKTMGDIENFDETEVYRKQVKPLIKQVQEICKKHGIPFVVGFSYKVDGSVMMMYQLS